MSKSLKNKIEQAKSRTVEFLDEKGITQKFQKASETVGDHLDTISGLKQLQLVEERLALQSQYNDILAQKLDEALERISQLEKELRKTA